MKRVEMSYTGFEGRRKEGNVLFNIALNTFYFILQLYGVGSIDEKSSLLLVFILV